MNDIYENGKRYENIKDTKIKFLKDTKAQDTTWEDYDDNF